MDPLVCARANGRRFWFSHNGEALAVAPAKRPDAEQEGRWLDVGFLISSIEAVPPLWTDGDEVLHVSSDEGVSVWVRIEDDGTLTLLDEWPPAPPPVGPVGPRSRRSPLAE